MIRAADVTVAYGDALVLAGVGLTARPGEVVGVIGPNGSGKTTLLRTLHRALIPRTGAVAIDDVPIDRLAAREIARRVAVLGQEGAPELPLTVGEMVLLGRLPHQRDLRPASAADGRIAAAALARVGARHLAERPFRMLSGGERQRVLIARALAQQASHLLLDEPTNHLDVRYQHELLGLVRELAVTTVIVLHDLNLAARYCDHLILLDRGAVAGAGAPEEILTPELLEPVYGVAVRRLDDGDAVQLAFGPPAGPARRGGAEALSGRGRARAASPPAPG
ncbi:MAG: ABC transporter ATP-binding protein [Solirubrobacteraceae bacterium]|nr:ABC transporter ATP-binding protein [Solirubrobacteraceae bacterium]